MILLCKPHVVPTLAQIVQAVIAAVHKYNYRSKIGRINIQKPLGNLCPDRIPQHFIGPAVTAIAKGHSCVQCVFRSGKQIVFNFIGTVLPTHREIHSLLRMHPIILSADANADVGAKFPRATRREKLNVSWSIFAFVNISRT